MKNKKKIASLFLVIIAVCVLVLSACNTEWQNVLNSAKDDISIPTVITENTITLPVLINGVTITWESSNTSVITVNNATATITRPTHAQGNKQVTLTATLTYDGHTDTKAFATTVQALPQVVAVVAPTVSGTLTYGDPMPTLTGTTQGGTYAFNAGQTLTAGTKSYNWTFTPTAGTTTQYTGTTGTIQLTVAKKVVTVEQPEYNGGELLITQTLPVLQASSEYGVYRWKTPSQDLVEGRNDYEWQFVLNDPDNHTASVSEGVIALSVIKPETIVARTNANMELDAYVTTVHNQALEDEEIETAYGSILEEGHNAINNALTVEEVDAQLGAYKLRVHKQYALNILDEQYQTARTAMDDFEVDRTEISSLVETYEQDYQELRQAIVDIEDITEVESLLASSITDLTGLATTFETNRITALNEYKTSQKDAIDEHVSGLLDAYIGAQQSEIGTLVDNAKQAIDEETTFAGIDKEVADIHTELTELLTAEIESIKESAIQALKEQIDTYLNEYPEQADKDKVYADYFEDVETEFTAGIEMQQTLESIRDAAEDYLKVLQRRNTMKTLDETAESHMQTRFTEDIPQIAILKESYDQIYNEARQQIGYTAQPDDVESVYNTTMSKITLILSQHDAIVEISEKYKDIIDTKDLLADNSEAAMLKDELDEIYNTVVANVMMFQSTSNVNSLKTTALSMLADVENRISTAFTNYSSKAVLLLGQYLLTQQGQGNSLKLENDVLEALVQELNTLNTSYSTSIGEKTTFTEVDAALNEGKGKMDTAVSSYGEVNKSVVSLKDAYENMLKTNDYYAKHQKIGDFNTAMEQVKTQSDAAYTQARLDIIATAGQEDLASVTQASTAAVEAFGDDFSAVVDTYREQYIAALQDELIAYRATIISELEIDEEDMTTEQQNIVAQLDNMIKEAIGEGQTAGALENSAKLESADKVLDSYKLEMQKFLPSQPPVVETFAA